MLDRNVTQDVGGEGIWIRSVYMEGFKSKKITAIIRPGDRSDQSKHSWLPEGKPLFIRFIKRLGDRDKGIEAEFYPDDGTTVEVVDCIIKQICDLTEDDLSGTAPDTATPELVRYNLAIVYNTQLPSLDSIVTIWRFKYLPNITE